MMKAKKKLTEKEVWKGTLFRAIALAGFYYFMTAISVGVSFQIMLTAFAFGGLYYFTELLKYYGMDIKKIMSQFNSPTELNTRKKSVYSFLLWA